MSVPSPGTNFHPSRHATAVWHGQALRAGISLADYRSANAWFEALLLDVEPKTDDVVRHERAFCSQDGFCDAVRDGQSLYTDNNHLGAAGQKQLIPALRDTLRNVVGAEEQYEDARTAEVRPGI